PKDRLVITRIFLLSPSTAPLESSPLARNQLSRSSSWLPNMRASFCIGSKETRRARSHQASRKPAAQRVDLYVQKCRKASFSSQARAVSSLLASRALSFCGLLHVLGFPCATGASA